MLPLAGPSSGRGGGGVCSSHTSTPPPRVRLSQGAALPRGEAGQAAAQQARDSEDLGTPVMRLAVPSPGEETGQRLEYPLPQTGKHRSHGGDRWGLTSLLRPRITPARPASASYSLTEHAGNRIVSKSYSARAR